MTGDADRVWITGRVELAGERNAVQVSDLNGRAVWVTFPPDLPADADVALTVGAAQLERIARRVDAARAARGRYGAPGDRSAMTTPGGS